MEKGFTNELVRLAGEQLKTELQVQPIIPLEIKLRVEKLWLAELIRGSAGVFSPSFCPGQWKPFTASSSLDGQ